MNNNRIQIKMVRDSTTCKQRFIAPEVGVDGRTPTELRKNCEDKVKRMLPEEDLRVELFLVE